jgi:hypothetical protein
MVDKYRCYGKDDFGHPYDAFSMKEHDGDWVRAEDHDNAMRAATLLREGLSKIIKEQERLLTYVYKHFPGNILLSDGWMEDCKEILAIGSPASGGGEHG